jgi:hypothetical protein
MAGSSTPATSQLYREIKAAALSRSTLAMATFSRPDTHVGKTGVVPMPFDIREIATFSRPDTHFGQTKADLASFNIRDEKGHRRYITFAYALAMNENEKIRPDVQVTFKIPGLSRVEWINAHGKAWPLPFYAAFRLLAATPLGKRCRRCACEHGPDDDCVFGQRKCKHGGTAECTYLFCNKRPKHAIRVCSTLNHRCQKCLFCGHQAGNRCEPIYVQANLLIFEASAEHDYVTGNRFRDQGAAKGFYPVIELCQLQHVSMHGGYACLLSLSLEEAKTLVGQGSALHEKWVKAEPLSTQFIVEKALQNSRSIKAYGEHAKHSYQTGKQYVQRQRAAPQEVGAKQSQPHADDSDMSTSKNSLRGFFLSAGVIKKKMIATE